MNLRNFLEKPRKFLGSKSQMFERKKLRIFKKLFSENVKKKCQKKVSDLQKSKIC